MAFGTKNYSFAKTEEEPKKFDDVKLFKEVHGVVKKNGKKTFVVRFGLEAWLSEEYLTVILENAIAKNNIKTATRKP